MTKIDDAVESLNIAKDVLKIMEKSHRKDLITSCNIDTIQICINNAIESLEDLDEELEKFP